MFQNRYGDFSDLEGLIKILDDEGIVVAEGKYDASQPNPGPHVLLSSVHAKSSYDFIKAGEGTYVVKVQKTT